MLRDFWKHSMLFSYWKKNSMIWLFLKYIHNFCWYCRLCFVLNLREAYLFCCLTYRQRDKYTYIERDKPLPVPCRGTPAPAVSGRVSVQTSPRLGCSDRRPVSHHRGNTTSWASPVLQAALLWWTQPKERNSTIQN